LLMTPLGFLLQVGGINHNGLTGMFDPGMNVILMSSSLGEVLVLRMAGFALGLLASRYLSSATPPAGGKQAGYLLCAVSALLLCFSFAFTGHTAALFIMAKMLLVLHVLAVLLWIGSLYPLLYLSSAADLAKVQKLMQGFGALAACMVAALLLAGIGLTVQLLQTPADLVTTSYGNTLLLKLAGVAALLLLAATNKLLLVPTLPAKGVKNLQRSIRFEIVVALYVVAITSWMTTVTGPAGA